MHIGLISNSVPHASNLGTTWTMKYPENQQRKWKFRQSIGIDEIAHHLANVPRVEENPDPTVQFLEGEFEHGGTRNSIYFLRNDGQNVVRSKADYMEIFEYDEKGNVLWSGKGS